MGQYGKIWKDPEIYVIPRDPGGKRKPRVALYKDIINTFDIRPNGIYKLEIYDGEIKMKRAYYFETSSKIRKRVYVMTPNLRIGKKYRVISITRITIHDFINIFNKIKPSTLKDIEFLFSEKGFVIRYREQEIIPISVKLLYLPGGRIALEMNLGKDIKAIRISVEENNIVIRRFSTYKKGTNRRIFEEMPSESFLQLIKKIYDLSIWNQKLGNKTGKERVALENTKETKTELTGRYSKPVYPRLHKIISGRDIVSKLSGTYIEYIFARKNRFGEIYRFIIHDMKLAKQIVEFYNEYFVDQNMIYIENIGLGIAKNFLNFLGFKEIHEHPFGGTGRTGPDFMAKKDDEIVLFEVKFRNSYIRETVYKSAWNEIRRHVYKTYREQTKKLRVNKIGIIYVSWLMYSQNNTGLILIDYEDYRG